MAVTISMTIEQNSQNVANNTTSVTVTVKVKWTGGSYNHVGAWLNVSIDGSRHGETVKINPGRTTSGSEPIFTETLDIAHDADGTKTLKCSASLETGLNSSGTVTTSASKILTMIPRASTLSGSNGTLGTAQKLVIDRKSDTFKHRITYNCGEQSGYANGSTDYITGDSYTWTPPLALSAENPTGTSVSVTLSLWTYTSNGDHVDTTTLTLSYVIPVSVIPTIDQITVTDPTPYSAKYGQFVQGLSTMSIQVETTPAYGAEITECSISANGSKYSSNPATTDILKDFGEIKIMVTVKDQRGRTATKEKIVYALGYTPPNVTALSVHRCNQDGTDNAKGLFVKVTFSATITRLNGLNTAEYKLRYYQSGQPDSATEVYFPKNVYTVTDETYIFAAGENFSYVVEVTATDAQKEHTRSTSASTAFTLMNFHQSGTSIGVGKVSERENAVEFGVDIYDKHNGPVYGWSTLVDMLLPVGSMVLRYDSKDPGTIYPGTTWEQITSRVLRAGGVGSVGTEGSIDSGGTGGRTYIDIAVWKRTK